MAGATAPILASEVDWLSEAQRIAQLYVQPPGSPPSTITDVFRVNKMLRLVANGNYPSTALLASGFSRQHLANWKEAAKNGSIAHIALLDALEKAEAIAESEAVDDVARAGRAGPQYWPASATRLERRHPERWGKRQDDASTPRVVVQIGVQGGDVQVAFAPSTTETQRKLTE